VQAECIKKASKYKLWHMPKELKQKSLRNLELLTMDQWQRNKQFLNQIKDQHPKLYQILNESHQAAPAYTVFQSQDPEHCYLRDDLKEIKASQFHDNYRRELRRPSELLETQGSRDMELAGGIDGTTVYETKYFLEPEKRRGSMGDVPGAQAEDGGLDSKEALLLHKKEKNRKIKDMNVSDMRNIYRKESIGTQFRNRQIECLDPIKGDLRAKKDPYEEHFRKRKQMIQNARLASQKMRNIKQLPKLSTSRAQNYT
jgi:hypothetical protein